MAIKASVGLTARLLGTCCMGGAAATTKSPMGGKPNIAGTWEDCPAFDLDPLASRQASIAASATAATRYRKSSEDTRYAQTQQVPLGEGDQGHPGTPGSPMRPAGGGTSGPGPVRGGLQVQVQSPAGAPPGSGSGSGAATPPHDSATELPYSDTDSPAAGDSPLQPQSQPRDRMSMQHRVALRLLERRGVLPADGAASSRSSGGSSSGGGGQSVVSGTPDPLTGGAGECGTLPYASATSLVPPASPGSAYHSSEYYTPAGSLPELPYESAVEADERLCLQGGMEDAEDADVMGAPLGGGGQRLSAPGLPGGRRAWGWPDMAPGGAGSETSAVGSEDNAPGPRMRGSDFGGLTGGAVADAVYARANRLHHQRHRGDAGGESADGVPDGPGGQPQRISSGGLESSDPRVSPGPSWSAAGGRVELSQEEKEWLFGQAGGIGGLASVMALGEGGEGLVDLVRLNLPARTLHLARKATRTCLPSYALTAAANGTGGTAAAAAAALALGVKSQSVSYRFPFEFFDREVKAMKAVKDSGFVIRFQAAAYDHDAGQGFILMEAAPYGTLEDLHAALCRSQLQPVQRQRPALLQRAMARLTFSNAKSSAPPSLALPLALPAAGGAAQRLHPASLTGGAAVAGGAAAMDGRPSYARAPGGGIGSCGGAGQDLAEAEAAAAGLHDRLSCASISTVASNPYSTTDAGGAAAAAGTAGASGPASACCPGAGVGRNSNARASMGGASMCALGSSLMSTRALRYYGACMLQALVALHEAGYIYRDLKLSNVLVCDGGRVRLTDFGAAAGSLQADQPGRFGGAAGTRAYLAPEVLPWLEAGAKGGGGKRGGGPEPYTVTVDSWTWGLVMVELATGWSLKELTIRIIRRVCNPRSPQPPDLPPDCGMPPALRQLLLDHVLIPDPHSRWPAARIRGHRFFDGLDWDGLAEAEGPHAHLFTRGRMLNTAVTMGEDPGAVAAAMRNAETAAGGRATNGRATVGGGSLGGWGSGLGAGGELQSAGSPVLGAGGRATSPSLSPTCDRASPLDSDTTVQAFAAAQLPQQQQQPQPHQPLHLPARTQVGSGRQGFLLGASAPNSPGLGHLSPGAAAAGGLLGPLAASPAGGAPGTTHRLSSTGFGGPQVAGGASGGSGVRVSSPGGPLIGPVVVGMGAGSGVHMNGAAGAGGSAGGSPVTGIARRVTGLGVAAGSRLAPSPGVGA